MSRLLALICGGLAPVGLAASAAAAGPPGNTYDRPRNPGGTPRRWPRCPEGPNRTTRRPPR